MVYKLHLIAAELVNETGSYTLDITASEKSADGHIGRCESIKRQIAIIP